MADLVEFRIVLPVSMAELQIASLYTMCIISLAETGGGEGMEWVTNKPIVNSQGQTETYMHNIIHLSSKLPHLLRLMTSPTGPVEVWQEIWLDFPACISIYTEREFMKDGFGINVEELAADNDRGNRDNFFALSDEKLARREVINIDIVNDKMDPRDYTPSTDPSLIHLEKVNRGPLAADWKDTQSPVVCIYKLVDIKFEWWRQHIVQSKIKEFLQRSYMKFYRMLYSSLDTTYDMTMEDIKALQADTKEELEKLRATGPVRGMSVPH